jgi:uncharacterized protein YhfF
MKLIAFILNIPWTLVGLICAIISIPYKISISTKPAAVVFNVKTFWWYAWLPKAKFVRGMAIGNIVLLGPRVLPKDLEHELVHVEQFERFPLIFLFLYELENIRHGYRNNKYEKEAYERAGNVYVSNRWNFGDDTDFANTMHNLILSGKKRATTGLYCSGQRHSQVGDIDEIVDLHGNRICLIRYTKIEIKPFMEVDFNYIELEGEGDKDLEVWRKKHHIFFSKYYPSFSASDSVVCCEFELVQ